MYNVVKLDALQAHQFGKVEGDFNAVRPADVQLPENMTFKDVINQVEEGQSVLITESPVAPMFIKSFSSMGQSNWSLSPRIGFLYPAKTQESLKSYLKTQSMMTIGTPRVKSVDTASNYVPEPVVPEIEEKKQVAYEYSYELACSDKSFRSSIGCSFELGKTSAESLLGSWKTKETSDGTRYTVEAIEYEPKNLLAKVGRYSMGISPKEAVAVKPIGTGKADEAFIAVVPSVMMVTPPDSNAKKWGKLGYPTEGYFYHIYDGKLVQEYKLLGKGNHYFYATASTHERLSDEQGFNKYQSAILVYWKLAGTVVENQYLVYLRNKIRREQLDALNSDWLDTNGIKLDINALVEASNTMEAESTTNDAHPGVTVLFEQPKSMQRFYPANQALYAYDQKFIDNSTVKPVSQPHLIDEDIPVVNIKAILPKVFAKSSQQPYGSSDMGTSKEPLSNFFDAFAHFSILSKAEANPVFEAGLEAQAQLLEAESIRRAQNAAITGHPANKLKGDIAVAHTKGRLAPRFNFGDFFAVDPKSTLTYWVAMLGIGGAHFFNRHLFGDDTQPTAVDLADGSTIETVPSQIRITVHHQEGEAYPTVKAFHVDNSQIPNKRVDIDNSGQMSVQLGDDSRKGKIYWTPVHEGDPDWYLTPDHDDNFDLDNLMVQPISDDEGMETEEFPVPEEKDWRDAILVFPANTGIPPLYVVYSENTQSTKEKRISDAAYAKLRKKTPSPKIRRMVNEGKTFPCPDEALPGFTVYDGFQADHIVSMKEIASMDGFEKLTEEQQKKMLNNPDNFQALSETANKSKGSKTYFEWTKHKKSGTKVNPEFREKMIKIETEMKTKLQQQINNFVKMNESE